MQFKVPQFLDIEDTIFGPFTFKEFVYLVGGGGACFILYKLLGFLYGLIPMLIVAGISLALTFYRPNGKPLIVMIQAAFEFMFQDKLYIWKRRKAKINNQQKNELDASQSVSMINHATTKLDGNKLRDLAWSLDVLDLKKEDKENK